MGFIPLVLTTISCPSGHSPALKNPGGHGIMISFADKSKSDSELSAGVAVGTGRINLFRLAADFEIKPDEVKSETAVSRMMKYLRMVFPRSEFYIIFQTRIGIFLIINQISVCGRNLFFESHEFSYMIALKTG